MLAQGRPQVAGPGGRDAYLALFTSGLNDLFLVAALVAFAGAVLSFLLIRQRDFVVSGPAGPPPSQAETVPA